MSLLLSKAAEKQPKKGPGPEDPVTNEREIGQTIYRALKRIATDLPDSVLETLDARAIVAKVPWNEIGDDLMEISAPLERTIKTAARAEIPKEQLAKAALPLDADPYPIEFALINQLAVQYAAQHSGSLVMEISEKMRETIATVVSSNVAGQLPRNATVNLLRSTIPLHSAWAETVTKVYEREYAKQVESGTSLDRANERATRISNVRSERLLQARSKNIARTEAMRAMNEGKYAGWNQQVAEGWMPVDSLKEWVEGRNPCKQCAPLVGQIVRWDEPFSNGQMMPPEHPSCRCTALMLPPDDEFLEIMDAQNAASSEVAAELTPGIPFMRRDADLMEGYRNYTASPEINGILRRGEALSDYWRNVYRSLIKGMDGVKLSKDVTLYRGMGLGEVNALLDAVDEFSLRDLVGTDIDYKSFVSTSVNADQSRPFGDVMLRIHAPKGTAAAAIPTEAHYLGYQEEVLLPPGTKLTIDKLSREEINGQSTNVLDVRVVKQDVPS